MPADDPTAVQIRGIRVCLCAEQLRIMRLIGGGLTYREIGRQLGMSHTTVYNRMRDVRNCLGTDSRIEAILLLRDSGIL